jgi:hypothetical protein
LQGSYPERIRALHFFYVVGSHIFKWQHKQFIIWEGVVYTAEMHTAVYQRIMEVEESLKTGDFRANRYAKK